jgi:hypothetical protein
MRCLDLCRASSSSLEVLDELTEFRRVRWQCWAKMAMGGLLGAREELRVLVPRRDQSWRRGELAAAATMVDWRRCVCTWGRKGCFL